MGKYYYKEPYVPSDKKIKYRKCKKCNKIHHYSKMEVNFMCKVCYVQKYSKKRCSKCFLLKPTSEFFKRSCNKDGYRHRCKKCNKITKNTKQKRKVAYKKWKNSKNRIKYYNNKRRCMIKNATLPGVEQEIREIYDNCPEGFSVDHIIPLKHDLVCGLNVPWNLQYLPTKENIAKSNKLDI